MTRARPIALLLSLAVLLAGPVSSLAALADGDCCCTEAAAQVDAAAADSCCEADADHQSEPSESKPIEFPGHCPGDCDCCVSCTALTPPARFTRPASGVELPEPQPDTWRAFEPQSHAIEAHFSLLRPPRS